MARTENRQDKKNVQKMPWWTSREFVLLKWIELNTIDFIQKGLIDSPGNDIGAQLVITH